MTLAKARAEANKAFKTAKESVLAGRRSARRAAEMLISVYWRLDYKLSKRDHRLFIAWFVKKHEALGKELGAK
jgi:hypothetical protein